MKINLKTTSLLSGLLLGTLALSAQEAKFTLTVKMTHPYEGYKAFLFYKSSESVNSVDSAEYTNGQFELKGKTLRPQRAYICLSPGNKGYGVYNVTQERVPVYLEAGNIVIAGTNRLKGARLSGTALNADFQGYTDVVDSFTPQLEALRKLYGKANHEKNAAEVQRLNPLFAELDQKIKIAEEHYFLGHLNSPVSLDWLRNNFNLVKDKSKIVPLFAKMGKTVKNSASGKAYAEKLATAQSVEIGSMAPEFSAKNSEGVAIVLSSFRGKYVLLDFWASWCVPCRKENPNVLAAYNAYNSKNFTVLGYSIDTSKSLWVGAVNKDALPWTQVSSIEQTGELAGVLYGITAIPSNFLIDPNGKIIARDLRGEELQKALATFIKG